MNQEKLLIESAKKDNTAYGALADYYEESGRYQDAAKAREKAGISRIVYP